MTKWRPCTSRTTSLPAGWPRGLKTDFQSMNSGMNERANGANQASTSAGRVRRTVAVESAPGEERATISAENKHANPRCYADAGAFLPSPVIRYHYPQNTAGMSGRLVSRAYARIDPSCLSNTIHPSPVSRANKGTSASRAAEQTSSRTVRRTQCNGERAFSTVGRCANRRDCYKARGQWPNV